MRRPFGIPLPRSQSMLSLRSKVGSEGQTDALAPRKHQAAEAPPALPPRSSVISLGNLVPNRSHSPFASTKADACGHYVRHSSKLTLLLSGQREGTCVPAYSNGETIEGILAIARPSGVLALDVKIEGTIHIQEFAGAGSVTIKTLDEKIYSWIASRHGSFPSKASFRYTLPSTYRDSSGNQFPLPPTFSQDLHGIPGFSVRITYAIVVNLTLLKEASTLWRGASNVCVPFRYNHRTRPSLSGPFPLTLESHLRTLFVYQMRPLRGDAPTIKVQLSLPSSQVCCYQDPIPFHVKLIADDLTLEPFAEYRPMPSSFLPLAPAPTNSSYESEQKQSQGLSGLTRRKTWHRYKHQCPLKIKVQRKTAVDANGTGFTFSPIYPRARSNALRSLTGSEKSASTKLMDPDRSYMYSTQSIGHGVVHSASRGAGWVVWSGIISIPSCGPGFSEGFEASVLKVLDSLVLTIDSPPTCKSQYAPLTESIPLRLTSDSVKSHAGIPVSSI